MFHAELAAEFGSTSTLGFQQMLVIAGIGNYSAELPSSPKQGSLFVLAQQPPQARHSQKTGWIAGLSLTCVLAWLVSWQNSLQTSAARETDIDFADGCCDPVEGVSMHADCCRLFLRTPRFVLGPEGLQLLAKASLRHPAFTTSLAQLQCKKRTSTCIHQCASLQLPYS